MLRGGCGSVILSCSLKVWLRESLIFVEIDRINEDFSVSTNPEHSQKNVLNSLSALKKNVEQR